jgi:hypothetical protein
MVMIRQHWGPPPRGSVEYRSSRRDASSDLAGTVQNAFICAVKALQPIIASVKTSGGSVRVLLDRAGDSASHRATSALLGQQPYQW